MIIMADPPIEPEIVTSTTTPNGTLKVTISPVISTTDPSMNSSNTANQFLKTSTSSDSKLSLRSSLSTPTSPHRLSSPTSLPSFPTPFVKSSPLYIQSPGLKTPTALQESIAASPKIQQPKNENSSIALNTGSATGNPRNKCALQPGHSLMDWIRLGNSGKDLTGVGGRLKAVSPKELAIHNSHGDAWLAIRGRVYNITCYLPYHPGGPDELIKGAGIDATHLFDKIHPWVNYESLLAKCLIGPLRMERPDAEELFGPSNPSPKSDRLREPSKAQELVRKSMENLANCITPVRKKITAKSEENVKFSNNPSKIMQSLVHTTELPVSISRRAGSSPVKDVIDETPPPLRYDWIQTSSRLNISIYTGPLANPGCCARVVDNKLLLEVATDGWLRTLTLIPEKQLQNPLILRVYAESGKIEVVAEKAEVVLWKNCGEVQLQRGVRITEPRTIDYLISSRSSVSHDTTHFVLVPKDKRAVALPIGHHVRVNCHINGSNCVRSYTPLGDGWNSEHDPGSTIHLAVKRYTNGLLSTHLSSLNVDECVTLSGPYGNFQLNRLKNVKSILMVAAGTGVTPMLALLKFMLSRTNPRCERAHLLFFNKKEEDILFHDKFEEISRIDNRFQATHVLSDASSTWGGYTGRVRSELLTKCFGAELLICKNNCAHFLCVCGSNEFTQLTIQLLEKTGLHENCLHAFMG